MKYLHRIADILLDKKLRIFGAVQITGPKWCGKTTTALQHANSVLEMQNPDTREDNLKLAQVKPSLLLKGKTPRLIDEWQIAPVIWDAVRHEVDKRQEKGQFILTGSTVIKNKSEILHSGTGRIARMTMAPMSLYESGESSGEISLHELFYNPDYDIDGITSPLTIEGLLFTCCRGGWPAAILNEDANNSDCLEIVREYVNVVCDEDISRIDGKKRNSTLARLILRSYARNICTLAKKSTILKDVQAEMEDTARSTFDDYVDALERLFVITDIDAWNPAIRSSTSIRSTKKRCFVDPSIAVAALGATPDSLEKNFKTVGFLFEAMCIRDLKAYSQPMRGQISYYHDRYGLEADIVLHLDDGKYALIECKLGSRDIEEGAAHLLELKRLIKENKEQNPQMPLKEADHLIVLTAGPMAYQRPDGVKVIPLGCLKD